MDQKELRQLFDLITVSVEGTITPEEFSALQKFLNEDEEAVQFYTDYMAILSCMRSLDQIEKENDLSDSDFNLSLWEELAEYEAQAESVEIEKPIEQEEEDKQVHAKAKVESPKRTVNKFSLFTAVFSTAALLTILIYARFFHDPFKNVDVATIVDQINVKWSESNTNLQTGSRLWTDEKALKLEKGIVKVHHDEGVDILIEGPTVFEMERSGIYVEYGQLYNHVSKSALGFIVETPTSQFIDHGTEFGVLADTDGSSEIARDQG